MEDRESPNSRVVDEIPLTLGFDSQMLQVEDVWLPNSCIVVEFGLDEIPSTSSFDFAVCHLLAMEVNPFHVIFNLNGVLITTCFDKDSCIVIFRLGLKQFLEKCLAQFQVYIWFVAQHHNIYNYLGQIWHKT
jgi:hypothetical protein